MLPDYVGCYPDASDRDLPIFIGTGMNHASCRSACASKKTRFFGLQHGGECYCGSVFGRRGGKVSDAECGVYAGFSLGNGWRNAIYTVSGNGKNYMGCFRDNGVRNMHVVLGNPDKNISPFSITACNANCAAKNYKYMSTQAGGECWCGNHYGGPGGYDRLADHDCGVIGNDGKGLGWTNAIYAVSYPNGQAANKVQTFITTKLNLYSEARVGAVSKASSIVFEVKARNDANICISSNPDCVADNFARIILGGWGNSNSAMFRNHVILNEFKGAVLAESAYKTFWISWEGDLLRVGTGDAVGINVILSVAKSKFIGVDMKYINFASAHIDTVAVWETRYNL